MLVGQVKSCAGDRQRHHSRGKGHPGPLHALVIEENARDTPATQDDEENRDELKQQFRDRHGNVSEADKVRDPFIEKRRLQLDAEERRIVRIKCRVQVTFDGGQVYAVIFESGVIAHCRHRQK